MESSFLARLARFTYRRRRLVVAGWLITLLVLTAGSISLGSRWLTDMSLPNTDSSRAATALQRGFPARSGDAASAVVALPGGSASPATAAQITGFADALRRVPGVTTVDAPVASRDGTVELVPFTFAAKGHRTRPAAKQVEDLAAAERRQGLDVELSGTMFDHISIGGHEAPGIAVA